MGQIDLSNYKGIYLQTAKEYIDNILSGYSKLSANLQDKEAVNAIYISAHSLKGQSQVMGFVDISNLCTKIENESNDVLSKSSVINNDFMNLLKNSIEQLNLEFNKIEKTQ